MADFQSIPVSFEELPCQKIVTLVDQDFSIELDWNSVGEFCTLSISDLFGNLLFAGKLVYGGNAFPFDIEGIPFEAALVPIDLADLYSNSFGSAITKENLGISVQLYLGKRFE